MPDIDLDDPQGAPAAAPADIDLDQDFDTRMAAAQPGMADHLLSALRGAGKGALSTASGLGELTTRLMLQDTSPELPGTTPNVEEHAAPFGQFREEFATPQNRAEHIGKFLEQVGEFFLPGGPAKGTPLLARMGGEALAAGSVAAAQHGDLDAGTGLAAGFGAAGPVVGKALGAAGRGMMSGARRTMARLLKPATNPKAYREAVRGIDQMLADGGLISTSMDSLNRSREALAGDAKVALEAGRAGDATHFVDGQPIVEELERARDALMTPGTGGRAVGPFTTAPHAANPAASAGLNRKIAEMMYLMREFGGRYIPRDALEHVRSVADDVYKKASTPEAQNGAWVEKQYGDIIRRILNEDDPAREAAAQLLSRRLNAQNLTAAASRKAMSAEPTMMRTIATGVGMGAGGAVGAAFGGPAGALIGATIPPVVSRLVRSTLWRTTSATFKKAMADLLQSGQMDKAATLAGQLLAGTSSALPDAEPTPVAPELPLP